MPSNVLLTQDSSHNERRSVTRPAYVRLSGWPEYNTVRRNRAAAIVICAGYGCQRLAEGVGMPRQFHRVTLVCHHLEIGISRPALRLEASEKRVAPVIPAHADLVARQSFAPLILHVDLDQPGQSSIAVGRYVAQREIALRRAGRHDDAHV